VDRRHQPPSPVGARVLPDATTQFTYVERNTNRRPTLVVSTFSTHDNTVRLRTNTFTYAANNLDLLAVREQPCNALLLTTSFLYDYNGRLVDTLHPGGYLISRAYDRDGRLTNLTDNAGISLTNCQATF
jgi:YD repeat-containing protein